jgi:CheY-like chemotaxis protein
MPNKADLLHLLLIEDDEDHAFLVKRNLQKSRIANTLDHVMDGEMALDYLYKRKAYANSPRPDVILLDLKLPKLDGHEVLETIKQDAQLMSIPVVVLTTSESEADRSKAYLRHANSYVVKPLDVNGFQAMVEELSLYWGMLNVSPP